MSLGRVARATPRAAGSPERLRRLARRLRSPAEVSLDGRLVVQARTTLPTDFGEFDVRLFQFDGDPREHLALSVGELAGDEPLPVRLHSECFTGEVLHSQRCECAQQLAHAMESFQRLGRGLVIYLRQEGRGIGLANKLRAYALQAEGADTVDANRLLDLPDDARTYEMAAGLLQHLGVTSVRLMTNNPAKREALASLGISVADRLPVLVASNPLAAQYLETKRERMRHEVPALEAVRAPE
jgi:GTP cyclohydrolase II